MKKLAILVAPFLFAVGLSAQNGEHPLPDVLVKDLEGGSVSIVEMAQNEGAPVVISFWATWCKPCILELSTIHDEYEEWQKETGVKLVAVSIDDARNEAKVKPFVDGKAWDYTVCVDPNQDLKRAMGVVNVPHTFVLDGKGNIVWQHNSYNPGDEEELYEVLKKVKAGEPIEE